MSSEPTSAEKKLPIDPVPGDHSVPTTVEPTAVEPTAVEPTAVEPATTAEPSTTTESTTTESTATESMATESTTTAEPTTANAAELAAQTSETIATNTPVTATTNPGVEMAAAQKRPVAIGSQRDAADIKLKPSQPKAVQAALAKPIDLSEKTMAQAVTQPAQPAQPVSEIKSNAGFSDDIDAEIEAALGGLSMADVVEKTDAMSQEIEPNTRVKGVVTKIHNDNVFFKLNGQFEGVATHHHFKNDPQEGDLIEVIVRGFNKEDDLYELAVPGAAIGVADWEDIMEGGIVEARVTGSNTGGLEVTVNSLRGFIPASQIDRVRVEDFSQYVNEKFPCVVMEVNPDKRKLVLSRRAILDRENEEKKKELLKELEVGQLREGIVTRLMDFGAFVDLGGIEGLIHISKISWSRVKHPSEVVQVGDSVKVKIEKMDLAANRISLSLRDTMEHPWKNVADSFTVDDIVKGTVTKTTDFGAFVKVAPGVEGLVHISELAYHRVVKVSTVVQEGQEIEVKILSIDSETQKMSLSHKACLAPPAPKVGSGASNKPTSDEVEEPARELAVPSRNEPLKGGKDRKSGGEEIGLNW